MVTRTDNRASVNWWIIRETARKWDPKWNIVKVISVFYARALALARLETKPNRVTENSSYDPYISDLKHRSAKDEKYEIDNEVVFSSINNLWGKKEREKKYYENLKNIIRSGERRKQFWIFPLHCARKHRNIRKPGSLKKFEARVIFTSVLANK